MKAGIMEIGDIFVINKADRPGVERVETQVKTLLALARRSDGWEMPVVRTIASEDAGTQECVQAIEKYRDFLRASEIQKSRSVEVERERLLDLVRSRSVQRLLVDQRMAAKLDELAQQVADRQVDPYSAAEELLRGLEVKL